MNNSSNSPRQQKKTKNQQMFVFKADIAKKYGVEASILIQHLQYSIDHHKRNNTHFFEGRYWTYDSIKSLTILYPFWSVETIRRIIRLLTKKNVIITNNFNKTKYDRTTWFAFKDEEQFLTCYPDEEPIKCSNCKEIVNESVDNHQKSLENPVDKSGIKNTRKIKKIEKKTLGNEPFIKNKSSETRRNGHVLKSTNRCVGINEPIPIYTPIYNSSIEEVGKANRHYGGNLKKVNGRKNTDTKPKFVSKITKDYILPDWLRSHIHEIGYKDHDIDEQILQMILYHEEYTQTIINEKSCVLGWFKRKKILIE